MANKEDQQPQQSDESQFNEMEVPDIASQAGQQPQQQQQAPQGVATQDDLNQRIQEMVSNLEEEYGAENVTTILVEASYNDEIAEVILDASDALASVIEEVGTKVQFYLHTENNGDIYLLRALKPTEWNSSWMRILGGQAEEFDKHHRAILDKTMVYPTYEQTDWDWEGGGLINSPIGMTRQRLVSVTFDKEVADTGEVVEFGSEDLADAQKAAKKKRKPSF